MTSARPPRTRVRRERTLTESLASIMLVLEACVLFFVTLNVFGDRDHLHISIAASFGFGLGLMVVTFLTAGVVRHRWGMGLAWVIQLVLVLCGILLPLMWVVGGIFVALWIFCFVKGQQIDNRNAAYREVLAQHAASQQQAPGEQ